MNYSYYKSCIVPLCKSTTVKTPTKLFIYVPNNPQIRKKWLKQARRSDACSLSADSRMYFCEDHFDLPNDMVNYMAYHIMGTVSQVRMKPGCMPSKFECQEDRRKRTCGSTERPYFKKKQKMMIIAECLKKSEESSTPSSSLIEEVTDTSSGIKMASDIEHVKDAPEDFESLIWEESDVEDENTEMEYINVGECEFDFKEDAEESEYLGPDSEKPGPSSDPLEEEESSLKKSSIPPHPSLSSASAEGRPDVLQSYDIVVKVERGIPLGNDDITIDENTFHLADEHQVFKQEAEQPQRLQCPQRGQQRGRRPHTRGGRGRQETSSTQWVRGNRLIEVNVNDEDVPEELREMVMQVVNAREQRAKRRSMENAVEHKEEWMDAEDEEDEALFGWGGISARFEWSSMHDYSGEREQFLPQKTGPVVAVINAYEAFRQYWDDDILTHIVTETNRYAAELGSSSSQFARNWYDTNIHEILILFSFWMMLGIIRMPSTKSCFTLNPLLQVNIFGKLFYRDRYESLCRALHFNDNRNKPTDNSNGLFCFGPILDHLNSRFKEVYIPTQNISIEESLAMWIDNLSFRQDIKTKAAGFGVKTYELCESATGYLWSFFLYLGDSTTYDPAFPSTLQESTSTVLTLIHPLLDKGYTLFINNRFSGPLLAKFLKARKTDCVGTLRPDRSNVPPLISLCKLKDGQFVARHSGDVVVLAFQDGARKFTTISTYHGNSQGPMDSKQNPEPHYKPQVFLDYNKNMGGVDRKDQTLEPYLLERKHCVKWYMKVFKRLLNSSILNARILLRGSTAIIKNDLVFRLELVDQLIQHHFQQVPKCPVPDVEHLKSVSDDSK